MRRMPAVGEPVSYPAYDLEDAPVRLAYRGDFASGLALEDRDLLSEARDTDACVDAAVEVTCALYPPLLFGYGCIPTITN